ncbi:bidirectional sugar transporter SWEET4 [Cornus florida]|uniref:bidirectional sugar transporter SWEET4 n=1 Tax=Cornus florida TaxID=4283 RepID=UPI0028967551|nr:bidirectional sugar transporter SWEET4 [Cornus florida]
MVDKATARMVVGILGNIISLILFTSPVPTFIRIWKKGSVEQYSPAPYLATLVNCGLWTLYGLPWVHPHSILVVTINGTGFVIELLYLLLFVIYSDKKKKLKVLLIMLAEFIFLGVLALVVLTIGHTTKLRSTIVGSLCMLGNVMMYASPLSVMTLVITTKSVEYMPFFLSLASFANGICWTSYALIRFDPFIAAPNGLGTLFGMAQLILYATYYKSTKQQMAARQSKVEMGLVDMGANGDSEKMNGQVHNHK